MPIALRSDYDATQLRSVACRSRDAGQTRRSLTLAAIDDGATRTEAAAIGGARNHCKSAVATPFMADDILQTFAEERAKVTGFSHDSLQPFREHRL